MSPLRNPWVSGALVVAALGFIAYQVIQPRWQRLTAKDTANPGPAIAQPERVAPRVAAPREISPSDPSNALPQAVEQNRVEARLHVWLESPARDPFFQASVKAPEAAHQYLSPVRNWKLKAIWRQTGGRIAAINKSIYSEGDELEAYRVRRIEDDGVWLEGPLGLERLDFPKAGARSARKP